MKRRKAGRSLPREAYEDAERGIARESFQTLSRKKSDDPFIEYDAKSNVRRIGRESLEHAFLEAAAARRESASLPRKGQADSAEYKQGTAEHRQLLKRAEQLLDARKHGESVDFYGLLKDEFRRSERQLRRLLPKTHRPGRS